jgi:hypothetical protein
MCLRNLNQLVFAGLRRIAIKVKPVCGLSVRACFRSGALWVEAAEFFCHSQAYKVIERDAVLNRKKLGPLFQRGRKAKREAAALFFIIHDAQPTLSQDAASAAMHKSARESVATGTARFPKGIVKVSGKTLHAHFAGSGDLVTAEQRKRCSHTFPRPAVDLPADPKVDLSGLESADMMDRNHRFCLIGPQRFRTA